MNSTTILLYEAKRTICHRKFMYLLLIIGLFSHGAMSRIVSNGFLGTAPYSRLSCVLFLSIVNPVLLSLLAFLWAAVFSEREKSARQIIFATPISPAVYYLLKAGAIAGAFAAAMAVVFALQFLYLFGELGFVGFADFWHPILMFLIPSAVFVFGLSMAMGKLSVNVLYAMIPVIFLSGMFNLGVPAWLDLCGNNFLMSLQRVAMFSGQAGAIGYRISPEFVQSRLALVVVGLLLGFWAIAGNRLKNK